MYSDLFLFVNSAVYLTMQFRFNFKFTVNIFRSAIVIRVSELHLKEKTAIKFDPQLMRSNSFCPLAVFRISTSWYVTLIVAQKED